KEGIEKIMEENDLAEKGFEIKDIVWLKKKDSPLGKSASIGIWLNTPEAAESIISNSLLVRQRYIGSVEPYKVELKRCYCCQKFSHLAWSCKEQTVMGNILLGTKDLVAIKVWTAEIQFLIFSVYIPPLDVHQATSTTSTKSALKEIENTIEQHTRESNKSTRLILVGDFNRHHPTWSHRSISHVFTAQAEELINFFQEYQLQWCLPPGTPTYWSPSHPGKTLVLDLTLTNDPTTLIKCQLYHDNYGLDHRGTYSEWDLRPERNENAKPKRAYDRADWAKIGQRLVESLGQALEIHSTIDLNNE
ncbi:hypothetical protein TSTA_110550, partial [Talaromyces stipitatus ATCC 10500]